MAKISSIFELNYFFKENVTSSCRGVILGAHTESYITFKALVPYSVSVTIVFSNGKAFHLDFIKAHFVSVIFIYPWSKMTVWLRCCYYFLQTVIIGFVMFTVILAKIFYPCPHRWWRWWQIPIRNISIERVFHWQMCPKLTDS